MRRIADNNEGDFSELAINTMRRAFYMDDLICSVPRVEQAKALIPEMQKTAASWRVRLGKIHFNKP